MSALADHPNAREARDLRRQEIEHAMRCLYRDPVWVDPDGDLSVIDYLRRINYIGRNNQERDRVLRPWLRAARIDPLSTVGELEPDERHRLIREMLRFLKASAS